MSPDVRVRLLEGFELLIDSESCVLPPSAERLVAYLALQARPVMRAHVAGTLWGDREEARSAACLRSAIWRVNQGHAPIIDAGRSRIVLHGTVSVDARDAMVAAHSQLAGGPAATGQISVGELLPGWYDDWVLVERERLRQLCLAATERLAQSLLDAGQPGLAIEAALSVVAAEPLRESAHRILIDAHVDAGNRNEAIRQFLHVRALLTAELGLDPGPALITAVARAHGPTAVTQAARQVLADASAPISVHQR